MATKNERQLALVEAARAVVGNLIRLPNVSHLEMKATDLLGRSKELGRVNTEAQYMAAIELAKEMKGCAREFEDEYDAFLDVYRYQVDFVNGEKRRRVDPLKEDERNLKDQQTRYEDEKARKAEEARRKAQAEADLKAAEERRKMEEELRKQREARLAAEKKATEERIAAERRIAEEKAKADKAEAERRRLEAEKLAADATSKKAAAEAARKLAEAEAAKKRAEDDAKRARAEAEAAKKAEDARIEAERIQAAEDEKRTAENAVQAKIVEVAPNLPSVQGKSRREQWSAAMVDRVKFVHWLAAQPNDVIGEYMTPRVVEAFLVPLNQQAKALKRAMHVDGVQAVSETVQSLSRTRKPTETIDQRPSDGNADVISA